MGHASSRTYFANARKILVSLRPLRRRLAWPAALALALALTWACVPADDAQPDAGDGSPDERSRGGGNHRHG